MQNIKKVLAIIFVFIVLILPVVSFAQSEPDSSSPGWKGLIPCSNVTTPSSTSSTDSPKVTPSGECDFNQLMALVNKIIRFVLFALAMPISAIMFAYAGFSLLTAQSAEAMNSAKSIFMDAVVGLLIALASWLIIRTLLSIMGYDGAWIGF